MPQAWTAQDEQLGWNWSFWDQVLRPVVEELGPEGPLANALVAPDSKSAVTVEGSARLEFLVHEVGQDLYLLACKREGETAEVHFVGLPAVATEGEVLFEARRQVKVEKGGFSD